MTIQSLNHVTIRPRDLETTRNFYVDIVGLRDGERPPFGFPGYWLYAGAAPVLHLIGSRGSTATGSGAVDHVAFAYEAEDYDRVVAALAAHGFDCARQTVPTLGSRQLFIEDPDGVCVELNFPAA
ncbi:MAG: glyoxalase [Rhodospirillaceae bacterium]|nr:glyoxalase [Rhodospirillaceae bacterium]MBT3627409.1 glyoxalase [Rhodospirillaceae bacterium]MBT3928623.1 glyoxalase [Rhodospirillaceae bacterium]MBT4426436.1 glyoxalase [Rhodospirillaceae bacterium]